MTTMIDEVGPFWVVTTPQGATDEVCNILFRRTVTEIELRQDMLGLFNDWNRARAFTLHLLAARRSGAEKLDSIDSIDEIGEFWVVTRPEAGSELPDIVFKRTVQGMERQFRGGLDPCDILGLFLSGERARQGPRSGSAIGPKGFAMKQLSPRIKQKLFEAIREYDNDFSPLLRDSMTVADLRDTLATAIGTGHSRIVRV